MGVGGAALGTGTAANVGCALARLVALGRMMHVDPCCAQVRGVGVDLVVQGHNFSIFVLGDAGRNEAIPRIQDDQRVATGLNGQDVRLQAE